MDFKTMAMRAHANSKAKGFWSGPEQDNFPTKIALIHSEVDEATEVFALAGGQPRFLPMNHFGPGGKPIGFDSEIADVVIRIGDLAARYDMDLAREIQIHLDAEGVNGEDDDGGNVSVEDVLALLSQMHLGASKALERYRDLDYRVGDKEPHRPSPSTVEGGLSFAVAGALVLAKKLRFDLVEAIERKMLFNEARPRMHGKRC